MSNDEESSEPLEGPLASVLKNRSIFDLTFLTIVPLLPFFLFDPCDLMLSNLSLSGESLTENSLIASLNLISPVFVLIYLWLDTRWLDSSIIPFFSKNYFGLSNESDETFGKGYCFLVFRGKLS